MNKKLLIFLTLIVLFIPVAVLLFLDLGDLGWIKVLIAGGLFAGAALFIVRGLNKYEPGAAAGDVLTINGVQEKRIQLKSSETEVLSSAAEKEVKDKLREIGQIIKTGLYEEEDAASFDQCKGLSETFGSDVYKLEKEMKSIDSNQKIIAQNTKKAFTIADSLSSSAKNAFDLSGDVQEAILIVTKVLHDAAEKSNKLFEQSKKISKIIEIISEIANKTHVLSINASIVSARAGKDGKAFEVVSKEIRKLANETDLSLGEIEDEVLKIQEIIRSVVAGINNANDQTIKENELLTEVIGALQGVTLGVEAMRAVSNMASSKTDHQGELLNTLVKNYSILQSAVAKLPDFTKKLAREQEVQHVVTSVNSRLTSLLESPILNLKTQSPQKEKS